jgi:dTDP-4-amino-4,6-dideoxygalactose transaminase
MSRSLHHLFPPYPLADQRSYGDKLFEAAQRVLESGHYILGSETEAFEQEFARYLGIGHVTGTANGTDGIELMLRALDIRDGSAVLLPAHAPSAVAAGVRRAGAEPVFADIDKNTFTLCPESVAEVLKQQGPDRVKAVLAVHLYGHPAELGALLELARNHGAALLEDASQSHAALWQGRMTGTLGRASVFSFYPTKNLAALGDAGAVATNDAGLAERFSRLRQYGWQERHISEEDGINSRLDELQAAMLRVKLARLDAANLRRRQLAAVYDARLGGLHGIATPVVRPGCEHVYHQYVIRCSNRDRLMTPLKAAGVPVAVHYPVPLHRQPAFAQDSHFPCSEEAVREVLSLPLHPHLSDEAVHGVCDVIEFTLS